MGGRGGISTASTPPHQAQLRLHPRVRNGEAGLIFRFPKESLFVWWDNAASQPAAADNPAAPFATKYQGGHYDATTLLRCKATSDKDYGNCPAGICAWRTARRRS